jgi:DNA helicase II / ATP-dependent DNA helicase PcrA
MSNKYTLTDEQQKYISQENGKIVLNACPGSGKTTTIAHKLARLIPKYEKINKFSGTLCLSFTNVAKDEILGKYQELCNTNITYPHLVCTIDHFINTFITLPFYHKLNKEFSRPKIIEDASFLDRFDKLWREYKDKKEKSLKHNPYYAPSTIEFEFDGSYSANGKKPDIANVDEDTFNTYSKAIKKWQCENGLLKTSDSAFIALKILEKFPQIGKSLVQKFSHIIIDEAQDTSAIQHAIFDKLIEAGLENIEFIGDPYQSLYEWRNAKPELFYEKFNSSDFISAVFTECKRSSQIIVDTYSLLRKNSESNLQSTVEREEIPIFIYRFAENKELDIVKKWNDEIDGKYTEKHVIVRGNTLKNKLLGKNDWKIEPWKSELPYKVVDSIHNFNNKETKKAISTFRKIIPIIEGIDGYHEKKERELDLKEDHIMNGKIIEILRKLPSFDLSLKEWTEKTEKIVNEYFSKNTINFELKTRNLPKELKTKEKRLWWDYHSEVISSLFSITKTENNIEVSTIHGIKGKTFDTTLVFLSKKHSQTISIEDIVATERELSEKQRMIYVAMSRPRHLLALAIPEYYSEDDIKQKLGENIEFK